MASALAMAALWSANARAKVARTTKAAIRAPGQTSVVAMRANSLFISQPGRGLGFAASAQLAQAMVRECPSGTYLRSSLAAVASAAAPNGIFLPCHGSAARGGARLLCHWRRRPAVRAVCPDWPGRLSFWTAGSSKGTCGTLGSQAFPGLPERRGQLGLREVGDPSSGHRQMPDCPSLLSAFALLWQS